jgi:hypothetical protein
MGDDPMALLGLEGALKHYYYYIAQGRSVCHKRLAQLARCSSNMLANRPGAQTGWRPAQFNRDDLVAQF